MDTISYRTVASAFQQLVSQEFPDELIQEITDEHEQLAKLLLEKFHEITYKFLFVDESENDQGGDSSDLPYLNEDGSPLDSLEMENTTLEYKKEAIRLYNATKGRWSFQTFQNRYKSVRFPNYITRWERHVNMGGTKYEIYQEINKFVMDNFHEARNQNMVVHDLDFRRWGMEKARQFPGFRFCASDSWVLRLKARNGIVSRKIQKLVSFREVRNKNQILEAANSFRSEINNLLPNYITRNVINTDQTGFNYEMHSNRTLSYKGERCTVGAANSPTNKVTHSYTVQYLISLSGEIVGDAYVCLQETNGKFGPIVESNIFAAPNLTVVCSKSGKLSTQLVETFLENVVKPQISGPVLYLLDRWSGQKNEDLYYPRFQNEYVQMSVKFIPECTTDQCQPLDMMFHRQLQYLVRHFYEYAILHVHEFERDSLSTRNAILKLQSLVHFLLQAPVFKPMIEYSWLSCGLGVFEKPELKNVKDVCFNLSSMKCNNCEKSAFIRCSWCFELLCFDECFHDYHIMICKKSPYISVPG